MSLENLKIIMKMKGFNAESLADKSGVPKSTVDKILSGNTPDPRYSTVKDLVNALSLNVDELIYYLDLAAEDVSRKLEPSDYELIKNYHDLDPHGKDVIDCLLKKELQRSTAKTPTEEELPELHNNKEAAPQAAKDTMSDFVNNDLPQSKVGE